MTDRAKSLIEQAAGAFRIGAAADGNSTVRALIEELAISNDPQDMDIREILVHVFGR